MAFDVSQYLTAEQRQEILQQRIQSWAVDAYGHQLNKDAILAADPKADTSEQDAALDVLTTALDNATGKLDEVVVEVAAMAAEVQVE